MSNSEYYRLKLKFQVFWMWSDEAYDLLPVLLVH